MIDPNGKKPWWRFLLLGASLIFLALGLRGSCRQQEAAEAAKAARERANAAAAASAAAAADSGL